MESEPADKDQTQPTGPEGNGELASCLRGHIVPSHTGEAPVTNGEQPAVEQSVADSEPAANGDQHEQAAPHQNGSNGDTHTNGRASEPAANGKEKNEEFTCCESVLQYKLLIVLST